MVIKGLVPGKFWIGWLSKAKFLKKGIGFRSWLTGFKVGERQNPIY